MEGGMGGEEVVDTEGELWCDFRVMRVIDTKSKAYGLFSCKVRYPHRMA